MRDASNLRSWILTVAHRKAIDHIRARGRRAVPVAEVAEVADAAGQVSAGAEHPDERGVWAQVAGLPHKQRTALALRFLADAAYAEIAGVMDTSEEAARRNVHEALSD